MSYLEKYPWNTLAAFLPRVCSQKWKWSTWISSSFVADQKDSKHCSSSKIFQNSNFLDNFSSPIFLCVLIWKRHGILLWTKGIGKLFSCYSRKRKEVKYVLPRWPMPYTFNQRGSKHDPVSKYNIELWISSGSVPSFEFLCIEDFYW